VFCNREVILAAGAIFSPALLQVSGIGPADVLNELNVSVKVDLPGVGQNFQDHPMVGVFYNCELSLINPPTLLEYLPTNQTPNPASSPPRTSPATPSSAPKSPTLPTEQARPSPLPL
jgi:hypothetical protein